MKVSEIKATAIWLETDHEVILAAYIISDLMGWDYVDDPDFMAFQAIEIQEFIGSQNNFIIELNDEKLNFTDEFSAFKKNVMNMNENEAVQFRVTEDMKKKIDEILPEFEDEEDSEE